MRNLLQLAWLKATGSALYIAVFFHYYFALIRNPAYPVLVLPLTPFDLWLPFQPWAFWPYVSQWIYICLPAALQPNLPQLLFHGAAAAALCAIGIASYYYLPSSFTYTKPTWPADHVGAFLSQVDKARNVFPSMHVAFSCFACVWLGSAMRSIGAPAWLRVVNVAWCLLTIYSTLAIKQHIVWDAAAGLVLGMSWGWATNHWAVLATRKRRATQS